MDAENVFWSEFLEMYKSLPILWKAKSKKYCNRVEKAAAYDKLVNKLKEIDPKANKAKVIKKIHIFRCGYWRALKNNKYTEKSGGGVDDVFHPILWYFDLLHFLRDEEVHGEPKSTMSGDNSVSDRSDEVVEPPIKRRQVKEDGILKIACEQLKGSNDAVMEKVWVSQDAANIFWYEFLEMYKSLPVLWKVNYCNRSEKDAAYDKLVDKLKQIDPEANRGKVIKKIHTLRSNYRRELKKGRDDESSLWYFDLLHFLTDQEEQSHEKSTMSDEESNDDISVLAESWASKYEALGSEQRILAKRIWADVLFHGSLYHLTEKMVDDIHHVLKGTSNTSTPTPSFTPYYEEYSYSPQPQFTFVAYEQNDETPISPPINSEPCDELGQNPLTDLPSTSATHSLRSRSFNTNNEVIQRSSSTPSTLKESIVSFSIDNEDENDLNNSYEIKEEEEYEDISYKDTDDDDDDDVMGSIDHEDDSVVEINNKNLCQNPEENHSPRAEKVAVSILNRIREEKLKSDAKIYINWKKLNDEEKRDLKRLQAKRDCVCDQCGRHFTNPSNFKLHLIRHSGIKNYECEVCNDKFYSANLLKRHSVMHSNSPPTFACKHCGKTFIYNNLKRAHERSHFKERRFKCQYCDKLFFSRDQQKDHELVHTQIRKHHCELCDQYFLQRRHLRTHYRSKTHQNKEQQKK